MALSSEVSRRKILLRAGAGFAAIPLSWLLQSASAADLDNSCPASAHSAKMPHRLGRAKSVIFLFMEGGPSHLDTFDSKPKLNELAGQKLPPSFKPVILSMGEVDAPLFPSKRAWKQYGESRLWVSDWLPHTAECIDDIVGGWHAQNEVMGAVVVTEQPRPSRWSGRATRADGRVGAKSRAGLRRRKRSQPMSASA